MHLTSHTALLPVIFATFRVLYSNMSDDRSKCAVKLGEFERPNFWDRKNTNIAISSMKITVILPVNCLKYHVVSVRK
jgi:hypothetical protein